MAIVVKLTGDLSDLESKLKAAGIKVEEVGDKADKAGQKAKGAAGHIADIGKAAGGFVLAQGLIAAPQILGGLASSSRDLELQMKKADVVFGENIGTVQEWAAANAAAMGLTDREAVNAAAGVADLLKPMGFSSAEAAEMSTEILGLSGALAEWSGGTRTATEVSDMLQGALLGDASALESLGISIGAADIEARLAAKGQNELTGAAKQQAEAIAIQELIMEKSTDAQVAYANGAGSAARKQAEMTAQVNGAKESLAVALGPAIAAVTTKLAELVPRIIEGATAIGEWLMPKMKELGAFIQAEVLPRLLELGEFFQVQILPRIQAFMDYMQPKLVELGDWVKEQFAKFKLYYESDIKPALDNIKDGIENVIEFVREHWPEIESVIKPVMEQVKLTVETVVNSVMLILGILIDLIGGDFSGAWTKLQELVQTVWDGIKGTIENGIELIKNLAPIMLAAGEALGGALMDGLKKALGAVAGFAGGVADAVLSAVRGIVNDYVIDPINRTLEFGFDTKIPGVGKININPPDLPRLASGMWDVPGPRGVDQFPALLAGGEMVLPAAAAAAVRNWAKMPGADGGGGTNTIRFGVARDGDGGVSDMAKANEELTRLLRLLAALDEESREMWMADEKNLLFLENLKRAAAGLPPITPSIGDGPVYSPGAEGGGSFGGLPTPSVGGSGGTSGAGGAKPPATTPSGAAKADEELMALTREMHRFLEQLVQLGKAQLDIARQPQELILSIGGTNLDKFIAMLFDKFAQIQRRQGGLQT